MLVPGFETKVDCRPYLNTCGIRLNLRGVPRVRMAPVFRGVSGPCIFGVHNNSTNNGIRALVERVFRSPDERGVYQPPPPCTAQPHLTLEGFRRKVVRTIGVHRPMSKEHFCATYSGRRRQVYERAVQSLEERELTVHDFGVKKAFVKAEKINFTAKPDPAPRVIQPRDPRYNVEVGVYLKGLEHPIYKGIEQVYGGPTVMKGLSAEGVAQAMRDMWDEFRDPVAIGLDASRFDQHVRVEMLRWEHSVYESCYDAKHRRRLRWLLSGQLRNKCYMQCDDGRLRYVVSGSRMSGDMNTSLGNCLIMCALVHRLAEERGVKVRLANNGDDCVVFLERRDCARFSDGLGAWFLTYGFKMKVEAPVDVFERVEFCQAHPVFDGEKWIMVRNPLTTLSKDAICVVRDYGHGLAAKKWLYAVGECGLSMTGGIPVVQEHYSAFLRHGVSGLEGNAVVQETGMAHLARGLHRGYREPTEDARYSFWLAFGINPSHQRAYEARLREVRFSIPDSPCIGPHGAPGDLPGF